MVTCPNFGCNSMHGCPQTFLTKSTLKSTILGTMNVTSISKFRKDAKAYFDQVIDDKDVLLITRNDGQTVVVMTLDQYNSKAETDYLNSTIANRKHLQKSIADARAGKVEKHDLIEI
jgi:antitoxin YefM